MRVLFGQSEMILYERPDETLNLLMVFPPEKYVALLMIYSQRKLGTTD